ncbi:MAG: methyltransferase domain-containing protein [Burkholderiales bacterium]|nr:methyltransferase domain-containing protein [Burkholderiales bacterium]
MRVSVRLNLGCGRHPIEGWVNVDIAALPGVDVVADLDACRTTPLPFADDSVSTMLMTHALEHIHDTLALMQELHRVAKPGALLTLRCPYGSSDDAFEDPTHCQRFFMNSFLYFSQPAYWRADYGYRGDWEVVDITLLLPASENANLALEAIAQRVRQLRNTVFEMVVVLRSVKPLRAADRALQTAPTVKFQLV